jgi:hypothetical protein
LTHAFESPDGDASADDARHPAADARRGHDRRRR